MLPGRKSGFRPGFRPDSHQKNLKRVIYTASGPKKVVRGREAAPGLPMLGPKPCGLHVFELKPSSPDLQVPISTPAPDLACRPSTTEPRAWLGRPSKEGSRPNDVVAVWMDVKTYM